MHSFGTHKRRHTVIGNIGGPFIQQFSTPLVVTTRGTSQHQRRHAFGIAHADDLCDHAPHRRAHDVRTIYTRGIHTRDRVRGHHFKIQRAIRTVGLANPAVIEREHSMTAPEPRALECPAPRVHAKTLNHHYLRAVGFAADLVMNTSTIRCDRKGHKQSVYRPALQEIVDSNPDRLRELRRAQWVARRDRFVAFDRNSDGNTPTVQGTVQRTRRAHRDRMHRNSHARLQ